MTSPKRYGVGLVDDDLQESLVGPYVRYDDIEHLLQVEPSAECPTCKTQDRARHITAARKFPDTLHKPEAQARLGAEPPAEPKAGDAITVIHPWVADFGQGWIVDRVESKTTYFIRHPNGSHVAVPRDAFTLNRDG